MANETGGNPKEWETVIFAKYLSSRFPDRPCERLPSDTAEGECQCPKFDHFPSPPVSMTTIGQGLLLGKHLRQNLQGGAGD